MTSGGEWVILDRSKSALASNSLIFVVKEDDVLVEDILVSSNTLNFET